MIKPNKVEVKCICGIKHVVKIDAKEEPCRCGAGVQAIWVGELIQPWLHHAPDRFLGKKPIITKQYWPDGQRVNLKT